MIIENIRNIAIGIAVIILLPLILHVGVRLVVNEPSYPKLSGYAHESKEYQIMLQEYDSELKIYTKHYFYIATVVGIIAIIAGLITPIPFLGMGFILGGVACLTHGYVIYWDKIHDLVKFISLLLALILLILSSYKVARNK